jgi:hypothetical protein
MSTMQTGPERCSCPLSLASYYALFTCVAVLAGVFNSSSSLSPLIIFSFYGRIEYNTRVFGTMVL